jgi:hypothetical protein
MILLPRISCFLLDEIVNRDEMNKKKKDEERKKYNSE